MKRLHPALKGGSMLVAVLVLAWAANASGQHARLPAWLAGGLATLQDFHGRSPRAAIIIFCLLHSCCASFLPFPGACTFLNLTAGAVFGFWRGCAVVYAVTMASGTATYLLAPRLRGCRLWARHREKLAQAGSRLRDVGPLLLIALRLSPVFPYVVLNLFLGLAAVPFGTFLLTTFVGIFFDVVLLNAIGAACASGQGAPGRDWLFPAFLCLLGAAALGSALAEKFRVRRMVESSVLESATGNGGDSVPLGVPEAGGPRNGARE